MLLYLDNLVDFDVKTVGDYYHIMASPTKTKWLFREKAVRWAIVNRHTNRVAVLGLPYDHKLTNEPNLLYRAVAQGQVVWYQAIGKSIYQVEAPPQAADLPLASPEFLYNHTAVFETQSGNKHQPLKLIELLYLSMGTIEPQAEVKAVRESFLEPDNV